MKKQNLFLILMLLLPVVGGAMEKKPKKPYLGNEQEWKGDFTLQARDGQNGRGKTIDKFNFTKHALDRMRDRQITEKDVCWVIKHADRHCTSTDESTKLCVDTKKRIGVILNDLTNTIVTVYNNMGEEKLTRWLKKRNFNNNHEMPIKPQQQPAPLRPTEADLMAEFDDLKIN